MRPPRLELRVDHEPDSVVVHLEGEVDILTVPKLRACVNEVIRTSTGDVVLDMRAVDFIDSAGVLLLLSTRRRPLQASRKLLVVCEDGPVMRLIELTRLTDTLGVTDR